MLFWAGLLAVGAIGWAIWRYNVMVALDQRAQGAWADIDAQLKRRHDLVPALVETVKGYASHERQTLREVVERRSRAAGHEGSERPDREIQRTENLLSGALRQLFALAEAYPQLRASERFGQLQDQLVEIEEALQNARRYYNAVVRDLNTQVQRFPDLVVARATGFGQREFFELDSPLEREPVPVKIDG